jgi:hypothetical protein
MVGRSLPARRGSRLSGYCGRTASGALARIRP